MSRKQNQRKAAREAKPPQPSRSSFPWRGFLLVVLAAEVVWGGWQVSRRAQRPAPPALRIDSESMNIQDAFRDQVEPLHEQLEAAVLDKPTPPAWLDLGSLYLTVGHYPQAELCLRHAQSLDHDSPDIAYALAAALDLTGRREEANEQYRLASRFAAGRRLNACHFQIGKNHLRLEQPEQALAAFRKIYTFLPASYEGVLTATVG